jgi:hypothetical protein
MFVAKSPCQNTVIGSNLCSKEFYTSPNRMQYRRLIIPGTSYFFTVVLQDRRSDLLIRKINELRQAFKFHCWAKAQPTAG